jgi:hypothetical protein
MKVQLELGAEKKWTDYYLQIKSSTLLLLAPNCQYVWQKDDAQSLDEQDC